MTDYDNAIKIGISYFKKHSRSYYSFLSSTKQLKNFMIQNNYSFSKEIYKKWLSIIKQQRSCSVYEYCRRSLYIFDEIIETGKFESHSFEYDDVSSYLQLSHFSKSLLDGYIQFASLNYSDDSLKNIKYSIPVFLLFCDRNKIIGCNQITHKLMRTFKDTTKIRKSYWINIKRFLQYLRVMNYTYLLLDLPFNKNYSKNLLYLEDLSLIDQQKFINYVASSFEKYTISMKIFDDACKKATEFYQIQRLSQSAIMIAHHACNEFKLFMEINHFIYSKELIDLWADYFIGRGTITYIDRRRKLYLIDYIIEGNPPSTLPNRISDKKYKYTVSDLFLNILENYLAERKRNGLSESTISGNKCDCIIFFAYLYKVHIQSLTEITHQLIKDFQSQDIHLNPRAKNSCSSSIKGLLEYLERNQLIVPNIHLALSCEHAPQVKIVHILSKNQLNFLEKYKKTEAIEDIAIILLGLRLGLRVIDVKNLKITDIDWEREVISFIQAKTSKSIIVPMPIEVGNALFEYLNNIRPKNDEPYIFITKRFPFSKISTYSCEQALRRAIEGSGEKASFHDLRNKNL